MKAVTGCVIGLIAIGLIMVVSLLPAKDSADFWWAITGTRAAVVEKAGAVVKVMLPQGHGSGVHVGDGYVVTAQHVVGDADKVTLYLDNGVAIGAEVLWRNKARDVALLHARNAEAMDASPLRCSRDAAVGDMVKASGNPYDLEFISMWGHVAGASREAGPWASVLVMDMTVAPGMSGGPVYDASGNVIGLTVGLMAARVRGMDMTFVPVAYAVPSSAICYLMARG